MAAAAKQLTVLITGASRGIGLGLVSTYAAAGYRVIAAARDPATAKALQTVVSANAKSVSTVALDISDSKSVAALPGALAALKPAVESLDVLINNAGVTNAAGSADTSAPRGLGTLESATADDFLAVYRTNVVGTWDVTQKLLPLLRKAAAPKVVNVSSTMGSVASTNAGPIPGLAIAYRASKSALNQLSAVQAREYNLKAVTDAAAAKTEPKGLITVVSLCPGWVDTDMGRGGGAKPPLTVEQSTTGILKVVSGLKASATAAFVNYAGETVAW